MNTRIENRVRLSGKKYIDKMKELEFDKYDIDYFFIRILFVLKQDIFSLSQKHFRLL